MDVGNVRNTFFKLILHTLDAWVVRGVVLTPSGEARHRTFQDWNKVGRLTRAGRKSWNAIGRPGRVDDRAPCSAL
jgi:hypothetical protein